MLKTSVFRDSEVYDVPWGLNDCQFRWVLAKMRLREVLRVLVQLKCCMSIRNNVHA
ncbi:unnamed protein product [Sphenostylis stenocarpa]|uniref:Uncharacterized protein n=1 Tax=Sphenostylis stenocarpa TaxID=92480 RepID=A0AA86SBP7_9FABA|nr:unnamed protein product [Sphenostylis stenocarpa]